MTQFNSHVYEQQSADGLRAYINKVFVNMALALAVTAAIATFCYYSFMSGGIVYKFLEAGGVILLGILVIAELGIAFMFSRAVTNYSTNTTRILLFVYSAITGITFAFLPMAYGVHNVFVAFIFATVLFVCCAIIGNFTKVDLTKFSGLFTGALIALVVVSLISMFIPALRNSLLIGYLGLGIFLALTAFDMQKIKAYYYSAQGTVQENLAIYGAFQLYLDFINVFLYVLRILGANSSRD